MNSNPLEKEIEAKIGQYAKSKGLDYKKFVSPANRGEPDRILLGAGGLVGFLELKRRGEVPDPLQYVKLRRLVALGQNVGWVDSVEGGELFINVLVQQKPGMRAISWGHGLV